MGWAWPKTMCACGHMADVEKNVLVCRNCWQSVDMALTGDGAHAMRSENAALKRENEAQRKALMGCRDYGAISEVLKWAGLGGLMRSKIMMRLSDVRYRPAALSRPTSDKAGK